MSGLYSKGRQGEGGGCGCQVGPPIVSATLSCVKGGPSLWTFTSTGKGGVSPPGNSEPKGIRATSENTVLAIPSHSPVFSALLVSFGDKTEG